MRHIVKPEALGYVYLLKVSPVGYSFVARREFSEELEIVTDAGLKVVEPVHLFHAQGMATAIGELSKKYGSMKTEDGIFVLSLEHVEEIQRIHRFTVTERYVEGPELNHRLIEGRFIDFAGLEAEDDVALLHQVLYQILVERRGENVHLIEDWVFDFALEHEWIDNFHLPLEPDGAWDYAYNYAMNRLAKAFERAGQHDSPEGKPVETHRVYKFYPDIDFRGQAIVLSEDSWIAPPGEPDPGRSLS